MLKEKKGRITFFWRSPFVKEGKKERKKKGEEDRPSICLMI